MDILDILLKPPQPLMGLFFEYILHFFNLDMIKNSNISHMIKNIHGGPK